VVGPNGAVNPLFLANWSTAGSMVKENFPLAGGPVYGAVILQPSVKNNTLTWTSISVGLGNSKASVMVSTPGLIEFRTQQGPFSNTFISTGTFSFNGNVLGTISI
jgi:hypothetical protein